MSSVVIAGAVAEARRRHALGERDLAAEVNHFEATLGSLCDQWRLTPQLWFDGGLNPPPVAVTTADGTAAVVKVQAPGEQDIAARVLRAADGNGYVRVVKWDAARGALLTERLGADLWTQHRGLDDQARVIVGLLIRAWSVPLRVGRPFESKAAGLVQILGDLGPRHGTAAPAALQLAAGYAEWLAATEVPDVVCHGDPHAGNVLRRDDGWALIDPDGFVGERAYDLGVVLRDACHEFARAEAERAGAGVDLLRHGCELIAGLAGAEVERVWRWGLLERVTTGLYLHWHGYRDEGELFLDTAEVVARATG